MTREELIEKAAWALWSADGSPTGVAKRDPYRKLARALATDDLLADPERQRPVVLLRAEDCACTYGDDCSHGPEPVDALNLAVWLHAELQHKLTLPCGECHPCSNWADETWRRAGRKPPHVVTWEDKLAETRGLYARLDDAIKLIEEMSNHLRQEPALTIGVETRLAALRADEPAEPDTRCMNGPAKQHTLHMVGIIKALKSAAGMDHLPLEPPSRDNFARLARAIADYWPREIGQPVAERDALLPRLAELAEAAGKQRSAEWLRTCATLPMEEWPPAPAYKGPMVPAAERDALSLLLRAMARKLVGYRRWTLGDDVPAVHQLRRERDALQARLDELTQMWQAEQQTAISMRGAYAKAIRERDALRPSGLTYPAGHIVVEHGEPAPGEPWPDCRHGRPQNDCTECPGLTPPTGGAR